MDGGDTIVHNAANLHLMVPNCSRYTSEGVNEIEGMAPDVAADWATLETRGPAVAGAIVQELNRLP